MIHPVTRQNQVILIPLFIMIDTMTLYYISSQLLPLVEVCNWLINCNLLSLESAPLQGIPSVVKIVYLKEKAKQNGLLLIH